MKQMIKQKQQKLHALEGGTRCTSWIYNICTCLGPLASLTTGSGYLKTYQVVWSLMVLTLKYMAQYVLTLKV